MCSRTSSVAYFAHDPAHGRLLRLPAAGDDGKDCGFTCGGCLVAGAGPRYRCAHLGCGFTLHETCARRSPRTLRSAVHPRHRLRRRRQGPGGSGGVGSGCCEVCGEDVKGASYACAACGVAVHPLCARMPGSARGPAAHPGGHEAWLVRVAPPLAPAPDGGTEPKQGKQQDKQEAAPSGCGACGQPLGAWRYRCVTCTAELHPRCLVPAADQCRGGAGEGEGEGEESVARRCCCGLLHDLTRCVATLGTALHYRGYHNG